jgi:hypothetical protein
VLLVDYEVEDEEAYGFAFATNPEIVIDIGKEFFE